MITVVQPDKPYKPEIGDVLWGAASNWAAPRGNEKPCPMRVSGLMLNELDGYTSTDEWTTFPLNVLTPNPFTALKWLGIDCGYFNNTLHNDPYTLNSVYGIVPSALITTDIHKYEEGIRANAPFPDLALDIEFVEDTMPFNGEIPFIQSLLMGSGYTSGCNHFDGSHKREMAKVKLSNDDWLLVYFWEWYNK